MSNHNSSPAIRRLNSPRCAGSCTRRSQMTHSALGGAGETHDASETGGSADRKIEQRLSQKFGVKFVDGKVVFLKG